VAKLLLRYLGDGRPRDAFFVFRGMKELHRGPIEVVLERQALAIVAEEESGTFHLVGSVDPAEAEAWTMLEERGVVVEAEAEEVFFGPEARVALESLVQRRVVFRNPLSGDLWSLSFLVKKLA
jgi:hypothetical protein